MDERGGEESSVCKSCFSRASGAMLAYTLSGGQKVLE